MRVGPASVAHVLEGLWEARAIHPVFITTAKSILPDSMLSSSLTQAPLIFLLWREAHLGTAIPSILLLAYSLL